MIWYLLIPVGVIALMYTLLILKITSGRKPLRPDEITEMALKIYRGMR